MNRNDDVRTYLTRITPRPALFFDLNLCDCCNLNCKGCGSFAPLARNDEFLDYDCFVKDIDRLSELAEGVMHHINILGGSRYYTRGY